MLEIVEADDPRWHRAFDSMAVKDVHYRPEYVGAYARLQGGKALCAIYQTADITIMQPSIQVGNEISCVYSYGGPLCSDDGDRTYAGDVSEFAQIAVKFQHEFWRELRSRRITSEFCRTHPFHHWHQSRLVPGQTLRPEKKIVCIDLREDVWKQMRKGHRSSCNKAREAGVSVSISDDYPLFHLMYIKTMERRHAEKKWWFDLSFLRELARAVPCTVMIAGTKEGPEAGCLLVHAYDVCYYQYAGSFGYKRDIGVGNLLVHEAAKFAQSIDCHTMHLGGGRSTDTREPLYLFKTGFSPHREWLYRYERKI